MANTAVLLVNQMLPVQVIVVGAVGLTDHIWSVKTETLNTLEQVTIGD